MKMSGDTKFYEQKVDTKLNEIDTKLHEMGNFIKLSIKFDEKMATFSILSCIILILSWMILSFTSDFDTKLHEIAMILSFTHTNLHET